MVAVRPLHGPSDCERVVELTAAAFPEEVRGSGLNAGSWQELELEDLVKQPWCWPSIGIACEDDGSVVGAIVLAFAGDPDTGITYADVRHRVGCLPTLWNWAYDHVLEERLKDHECLVEFVAVAPADRGKGVGSALMRWAEKVAVETVLSRWPSAVAAKGHVLMTLWVAVDNAAAVTLYQRQGYATTSRTDYGACSCLHARLLTSFLGHPVWAHMTRDIPVAVAALSTLAPPALVHGGRGIDDMVEDLAMVALKGKGEGAPPPPTLAHIHLAPASRTGTWSDASGDPSTPLVLFSGSLDPLPGEGRSSTGTDQGPAALM